jgi:hypothetical protein
MASGYWDLWLTPTISLSLIIESERTAPSLVRFVSQFALLWRPSLLQQSLHYELDSRPGSAAISAATLRVVDYAYYKSIKAQVRACVRDGRGEQRERELTTRWDAQGCSTSTPIYPEELVVSIGWSEGISSGQPVRPVPVISRQKGLG